MLVMDRLIAHRGASAYAPENTMVAFEKARALGSNFVEFDVMLSSDGQPFVFHDETLNRTSNGVGELGRVSASYIESLDAGGWFGKRFREEKIPSLSTVLQWLIANQMQANIEIKPYPGTAEHTVVALLAELNRLWPEDREFPLLSSFDVSALTLCRNLAPEAPLGLLLDGWSDTAIKLAMDLHCYSIHLNRRLATTKRVAEIKQRGFWVAAYTVNSKRLAKKLLSAGVDALFTDYPDLLS